jgi:hypothetical protein
VQPAPRRRVPWLWITVGAAAAIALVIVAVVVTAVTRPDGPSSVDALRDLLIDVPGHQTTVATHDGPVAPAAGSPNAANNGVRWSATRSWTDGQRQGGVTLTQFDSASDAATALVFLKGALPGPDSTSAGVPGLENAFTVAGRRIDDSVAGVTLQAVFAYGAKGTILILAYSNADPVETVRGLLVAQANRLA